MRLRSDLILAVLCLVSCNIVSPEAGQCDEAEKPAWSQYNDDGEKYFKEKNYTEAEKSWSNALDTAQFERKKTLACEKNYNTSLKSLSRLYYESGNWEPRDKNLMLFTMCMNSRISDAIAREQLQEAEELSLGLLRIREKGLPEDDRTLFGTRVQLGQIYIKQGKYADAECLYRQNLKLANATTGPMHSFLLTEAQKDLAEVLITLGNYKEAESILSDPLRLVDALGRAARFVMDQGKYLQAESLCKDALKRLEANAKAVANERMLNQRNVAEVKILEQYAQCLRKTKRIREAKKLEARAESIKTD
ncbi:hypothetical protein KBI23_21070 [bacterium]|nr:hypothetical protein [bacterium]MBP9807172.1 hypothetical protein [bacterium]